MVRVLVIEDEPNMRKLISLHLRADAHSLVTVGSVREGLAALETQDFDAIVTVVVLTAFWNRRTCRRNDAQRSVRLPDKSLAADNLKAVIARAAQHTLLKRENTLLRNAVDTLEGDDEIYGKSERIRR